MVPLCYNEVSGKIGILEEVLSMNHDINLNIHYSAPKEIWEKIEKYMNQCPIGRDARMDLSG